MFLLAYRSSKHAATGVIPSGFYFGKDLRVPLDLLQEKPPDLCKKESQSVNCYIRNLKNKLGDIRSNVREKVNLRSSRMKIRYDQKARQELFSEGQKVWFFNPQKVKGKSPKL